MEKQEFLDTLRMQLEGELDSRDIENNVKYYDNYIGQQANQGKSETEVLEEIGSPLLIARTILDTADRKPEVPSQAKDSYSNQREEDADGSRQTFQSFRVGGSTKWIILGVIILLLVVVFSIVGSMLAFVARFFVPILVIVVVVTLLKKKR